jgi:hypothetical protein
MTTTGLKTRVLTNGKSTWRLTRFSDAMFVATNSFGKKHVFRCVAEVINFEDFLTSKGYSLRESGRTLGTIKRVPATA